MLGHTDECLRVQINLRLFCCFGWNKNSSHHPHLHATAYILKTTTSSFRILPWRIRYRNNAKQRFP